VITTDDIHIHLADIPFIRLRGVGSQLLSQKVDSYEAIVDFAQENLERFNLMFDLRDDTVRVGKREVTFGPSDHFVYAMFAYLRKMNRGEDGFVRVEAISLADFDAVCRLISKAKGVERGCDDFFILREDALMGLNYDFYKQRRPNDSDDNARAVVKKTLSDSISAIKSALRKAGVSDDYAIVNKNRNRKKLEPMYGLRLEPDRITLP
jgi:hypothetical protein